MIGQVSENNKRWLYLAVLSIIWGSSFILIKKGLVGLTPFQLASLRMIFAATAIGIYSFNSLKKIPKIIIKGINQIVLLSLSTVAVSTASPPKVIAVPITEAVS